MRIGAFFIMVASLLVSCEYFEAQPEEGAVARVNESYLYFSDIEKLVPDNTSPQDSALIVSNYINRWATQQLLIDQANINLRSDKLEQFDKLVAEYKNDLLIDAYKNVIVGKQLDSTITDAEFEDYYAKNKENFKLNEIILKVRFLHLPVSYEGLESVKEKFIRYNEEDKTTLNGQNFQFISSNLNDSVWVKREALLTALPILRPKSEEVLKKSNFSQFQDSLGVYLMKIENILNPNEIAPLPYIKPTLRQIILNKRKLELIRKLETDITRDAIEQNKFETYPNE